MNFPESQRTGALGELDVIRLFTDWQWSVGRYLIDSGYDLYVTPDHGKYRGISLYVQVKGTAKTSDKRVTALVSRSRLRTYAEAMLPVFIVRATADGHLFWTDAQEWGRTNSDQLEGPGSATVAFAKNRRLSDREGFESYLTRLLPTVQERVAAVAEFSERSRYLNSLDSRLGIRLSKGDQSTEHHLFAKDHSFEAQFSFRPLRSPDNLKSLREAIELGLPRAVEIESFNMTGSPVFEEIGANHFEKGTLTIAGVEQNPGVVRLYPGTKHSVTAQEFAIEADLFKGTKGFAVSNEARSGVYDFNLRAFLETSSLTVNIGFRPNIAGQPVRLIDALRPLADWCDQVVVQNSFLMELCFKGVRAPVSVTRDKVEELWPFLRWARTLSRLHLVAKVLGSNIALPEDLEMSLQDVEDIDLAFALLKGDRRKIRIGAQEFEPAQPMGGIDPDLLYTTTTIAFSLFGQLLGEIPVGIDYTGFVLEQVPGSMSVRLSRGENGQAWISHAEQDAHGEWVNRKALVER